MNNEFTKTESKILKGIAVIFIVGVHLYNRTDLTGYYTPIVMIGDFPLIYYISFLFDACVPIYCFCSGYAAYISKDKPFKHELKRLLKLLINYWIVLLLTCILGIVLSHNSIPNDLFTFIGNVSLFRITYVGAWWFMQTYVLLVLTSRLLIKLINNSNVIISLVISLIIYLISYYFRIMNPISFDNLVINSIFNALVLYGTSQFAFIIGILFKKYSIISVIRNRINNQVIGYLFIVLCIIGHIIVKSMIIAPFVAIVFIIGYSLIRIEGIFKRILLFFAKHSTNIWLLHMQFYMIFFKDIVFITDTVVGCFVILLGMCIISSYIIKTIQNKFLKFIHI